MYLRFWVQYELYRPKYLLLFDSFLFQMPFIAFLSYQMAKVLKITLASKSYILPKTFFGMYASFVSNNFYLSLLT